MNFTDLLFSHAGNINRRTYAWSVLGLFFILPMISGVFPPAALLLLPAAYAFLCLTVKRLHDIGLSGKWALLPLVAVATYVMALLLSGVIAFGAGLQNAGEDAEAWAGAVGGWLAIGTMLAWGALIVMPGNVHSRTKFGRPAAPLIAPPVPDLKAMGAQIRDAAPDVRKAFSSGGRAFLSALAGFSRVNYLRLFLSASGRISRGAYIAAFILILFVFMLSMSTMGSVPALNWATALLFFYCMTCLASKRLHDFGASGWLAATPFAMLYAYGAAAFVMILVSIGLFGSEIRNHPLISAFNRTGEDWTGAILIGSLLAYAVIGLVPGQRATNRYGDVPSLPEGDDDLQLASA